MMHGRFEITCARRADGTSALAAQRVSAPMHLSKPYWDGNHLIVNAVNSTAGIFSGDEIRMDVRVEEGASMVLTSPSANRVHRARDGRGILTQRLETGEGATLLCYPELFIPHAGCRYTQRTEICTHERSICVFAETIAPGRTASGEMFAFEEIQWETVVRAGARLVAMERYRLTPGHPSLRLIRENHSYFGTLFVLSGKQPGSIPALLDTVREVEIALLGASALPGEGCVIRLLAENSIALRKAMVDISGRVLQVLGIPEPELRKL